MSDNPWLRLPAQPDFVLPEDEPAVREFNERASQDHILQIADYLPEPFIGDPASPVLLLSNNPGFSEHSLFRKEPGFMTRIRDCISRKLSDCPFYYLAPGYRDHSRWWRQKLKCLLQRFGDDVVARSVCNVVYFPYVSTKFPHCKLPSQEFSFRLVSEAMGRGAVIVLMRKGRLKQWQNKVPGLGDYENLILLRNPQMPAVSPKNCNAGDYDRIVAAIEQAERDRQKIATDHEKARQLFHEAGLAFPTIPKGLAAGLKEQGKWLFATRELKMSPYNLQHYIAERDDAPAPYVVLGHSGHGTNSYAIQYYLVSGPLRLFLHLGWGGVYMEADAAASKIRECFALADEIVATAMRAESLAAGDWLTIVGSDFYGSYWSALGQGRQTERGDEKPPAEVLTEVLHWLKNPPPNTYIDSPVK